VVFCVLPNTLRAKTIAEDPNGARALLDVSKYPTGSVISSGLRFGTVFFRVSELSRVLRLLEFSKEADLLFESLKSGFKLLVVPSQLVDARIVGAP
jgi:hypothetical protein